MQACLPASQEVVDARGEDLLSHGVPGDDGSKGWPEGDALGGATSSRSSSPAAQQAPLQGALVGPGYREGWRGKTRGRGCG